MFGSVTQVQGRGRAAALPIEERRSAIVAATLPLFLDQGAAVTTREIAEAACIAEGTIFRVFADKTALLDAVIEAALDTASTNDAMASISAELDFEHRLVAAVDILRERVLYLFRVFSAASGTTRGGGQQRDSDLPALTAIFAAESAHLSRPPAGCGPHPARPHVRVRASVVRCRRPAHVGRDRRGVPRRHPPPGGR